MFDTGASVSISNNASDFVTSDKPGFGPILRGITSTAIVKVSGTVKWIVKNNDGVDQVILTHAYYVLDASVRLFSPQKYIKQLENAGLFITSKSNVFAFEDKSCLTFSELNEGKVSFPLAAISRCETNNNQANMYFPPNRIYYLLYR